MNIDVDEIQDFDNCHHAWNQAENRMKQFHERRDNLLSLFPIGLSCKKDIDLATNAISFDDSV